QGRVSVDRASERDVAGAVIHSRVETGIGADRTGADDQVKRRTLFGGDAPDYGRQVCHALHPHALYGLRTLAGRRLPQILRGVALAPSTTCSAPSNGRTASGSPCKPGFNNGYN